MYRSTSENRRPAPCTCVDLGTDLDSRSIDILFYDLFSSASSLHGGGGGGVPYFIFEKLAAMQRVRRRMLALRFCLTCYRG